LNAGDAFLPQVHTTPVASPTAPIPYKPNAGLEPALSPPVEDLGVPAQFEEDSLSIAVVETCTNILEALNRDKFEELHKIITNIMPAVTSDKNIAVFTDTSAQVTMFVPPRADVAGVLRLLEEGQLTAEEVFVPALVLLLVKCCHRLFLFQHLLVIASWTCCLADN
jgi:hypothetical protein